MSPLQRTSAHIRSSARRLSGESGIALIMAIAVMLVLTVLVTSALAYTSSDSRDSSRSSAGQKAYAAAEAGINDALAAVQNAGSDTAKMKAQPDAAPCNNSCGLTNLTGGAKTYWGGSFDSSTKVWRLKSIGWVPNPTGAGASAITRTITQTAAITPPPYNFVALNSSCDAHTLLVQSSGQLTVTNKMFIDSCNSGHDAFDIFGTSGNISAPDILVNGGWETKTGDTVTVNGTVCSLQNANPPTPGTAASYSPAQSLAGNVSASQTTITSSGTAIQNGDVIQIDTEDMLVTAGGGTTALTVQRGYDGTTPTSGLPTHSSGTAIKKVPAVASQPAGCPKVGQGLLADPLASKVSPPALSSTPACAGATQTSLVAYAPAVTLNGNLSSTSATSVPIKWTGATTPDPVKVGDVIMVDNEQMVVSIAPATNGSATLTVQRAYNSTGATHNNGAQVNKVVTSVPGTAVNPAPCVYTFGSVTLNPGTYYGGICIGSLSSTDCDGANCTTTATTTAYTPAVTLNTGAGGLSASTLSVPVKWTGTTTPDPVSTGDVIQVNSEQMTVTSAPVGSNGTATLVVTRATPVTHADKTAVVKANPLSHVSATLNPGTYIMAGGGFRVCGASTLSAPGVMIYNTNDPSQPSGNGALDQIELNTTGSVSLRPQADGAYEGLTIFQDPNLALAANLDCNSRNNVVTPTQTQINEYDIALMSAAPTTETGRIGTTPYFQSGALGSISGSIYAPANRSDFVDFMSGTANLAVLTSCILVDGGDSTFAFDPGGLFGTGWALGPEAG